MLIVLLRMDMLLICFQYLNHHLLSIQLSKSVVIEILNTSQFDVSWYWEFGDNSYSYDENPTTQFGTEGSYKIELTTYNTYGCSDTASTTVFAANDLIIIYRTHLLLIMIIKMNLTKCLS